MMGGTTSPALAVGYVLPPGIVVGAGGGGMMVQGNGMMGGGGVDNRQVLGSLANQENTKHQVRHIIVCVCVCVCVYSND